MATNKQRRDSERQRLQRQLEERRKREVTRRRNATIGGIVGALVLVAAVIVIVVTSSGGGDGKSTASKPTASSTSASPSASPSDSAAAAPVAAKAATACAKPSGSTARYAGVTVTGATDLKAEPKVAVKLAKQPTDLACQDLVVGKGAKVTASSAVTFQYVGALSTTGKVFQASWTAGGAATNSASGFVPGFSQAIIGSGKVSAMHAGGRRMILIPAASAYGSGGNAQANIPADTALVFIVDITKVAAA